MRSTRRKMLLPALLAMLALGAIAAGTAQAATAEGPFYKITGARLASGASKEVTAKASSNFMFAMPSSQVKVECSKAKFASGAKLLGSTGANSAGGEGTLEFSGCFVESGYPCELTSTTIKTEPLKWTLAYLNKARTGPMAIMMETTKRAKGLFHVKFTEDPCVVAGEWIFGGYLTGYVEVAHKLVEAGKEPAAAKVLQMTFPGGEIRQAWIEKGGALEEKEPGLITIGDEVDYYGGLELELGGAEWGVFT
jgi:hypothetical protein